MAETSKTNIGLQFFKGWYGKGASKNLPATSGAIIFNEEEQIIYVNGKPYGGASSVSFADNVLTITYSDGRATQTLDFNDTASATATLKVFERIDNLIGPNINVENGDGKLNYTNTNYLSEVTTLVGADRALDAQIKAINDEIDAMDVESNTVDGTNVHVTYKQEDGKVTVESVTEDYATLTNTRYAKATETSEKVAPALGIAEDDGGKLLKASDTTTVKNYVDDKVQELRDEVNSQVDALDVDGYVQSEYENGEGKDGNIHIAGIKEENGKISRDTTKDVTINVNHEYSKDDTNLTYLATAETVRGAIDSLDKESTDVARVSGQTTGNISFKYSETDGVVTIDNLEEKYATTTVTPAQEATETTEATDTIFETANGTQLATGADVKKAADFANTRIGEEIAKLDVGSQVLFTYGKNADDSEDKTHIVITKGISETDGKIAVAGTENLYFKSAVTEGNRLVTEAEIENMLGALVYRGTITKVEDLPSNVKNGDVYVAANAFDGGTTYGSIEAGDMFIYTKGTEEGATGKWQVISGENQVTNENATITAGAAEKTKIATVDGTDITVDVHVTAGSATIATVTDDVVTIKAGVKQGENTGTLAQGDGADIVLAKVAHTGKAEDVSVADTDGVITATTVEGALVEIATEINAMDADLTATDEDEHNNITVSLKEEDGVVTELGVDVTYATIDSKKDEGKDTELTGTDGTGLLIGTDVATLATFTNTRIAEEVAKLDATVTNDDAETQEETVKVTVTETDGKLTAVSAVVLGADVKYTEATETAEANLEATEEDGAVLGSDIANIKSYVDAKAAKGTTTITNSLEDADAIVVTESIDETDGHTNYDVKLVWSEWSNQPVETPTTPEDQE